MNAMFQLCVLVAMVTVALCVVPAAEDPSLRLVTKLHKLHKAGVISEDYVSDACAAAQPALAVCAVTPAAPGCEAAELACGVYGAVKGLWNLFG